MNVKNGFLTSEFWVNVLVQVVSISALLGFLTPEDADKYTKAAVQVGSLIAMVLSAMRYSSVRTVVKVQAAKEQANVECAETVGMVKDEAVEEMANKLLVEAHKRASAKAKRAQLKKIMDDKNRAANVVESKSPPGSVTVEDGKEYREK
jgi:hypothetical protein